MNKNFIHSRFKSLYDAGRGIVLFWTQTNMRIHLCATVAVLALGAWIGLTRWEWTAVAFAIALVVVTEAMNTALEIVCDAITLEYHPRIRDAKDVAAGAVLLSAIASAVIGAIVFIPHLIELLQLAQAE